MWRPSAVSRVRWGVPGGFLSAGFLLGAWLASSQAQVSTVITPDGTLGTSVTRQEHLHTITGGTRPEHGPNLFHSFAHFRVGTGDTARFSTPAGIENIVSRVTGGQQSVIDGQLQATSFPGVNLYLLNPRGVLFGPNARLDISGSLHVSTADYLRLADGATFAAHVGEKSTLTVAPPAAFGFLGPTPAPITIRGSSLQVSKGQALSVVGGDIQIVGGALVAPSGQVQLTSVAAPGEVRFSPLALGPDLQGDAFARLGRVDLSQGTRLDASGNGGGTVVIRSGRLLVDNARLLANTLGDVNGAPAGIDLAVRGDVVVTQESFITADTVGAGAAGVLRLSAGSVRMEEGSFLSASAFQGGKAGSIDVRATHITLTGGAQIGSGTFGPGQGGTVRVTATDTLTLAGTASDVRRPSGIFASTEGTETGAGNAGSVVVEATHITLTGGAQISSSTFGPGQGGTVRVTASDTLTLAGTASDGHRSSGIFASTEGTETGAGNAGSVVVEAAQVALTGGAQILSGTFGPGQGGTVRVTATDTLTLAGTAPDGRVSSGILASTEGTETGAGNAGSVVVEAAQVALTGGAQILSNTFGPGQGGTVRVTATDTLTLAGTVSNSRVSSAIFASAEGSETSAGNAGSIVVEATHITLTEGAQIGSGTFGPGQGGTVRVTATDTLTLAGTAPDVRVSSGIFASTQGTETGAGNAGSVVVEAAQVSLTGGAQIRSSTRGPGQGGTVRVMATDTLTLAGTASDGRRPSGIFASTQGSETGAGNAGSIVVEATQVSLTGGAQMSSSTLGPGRGGTVTVTTAEALLLMGHNSGLQTTAAGSGPGGDILVEAPQVQLTEGAVISAESVGVSNAGSITITVRDTFLSQHSTVTTNASHADGGNIRITAPDLLRLRDSQITATVGGGPETVGGNITIDPQFLLLQDSQIEANAFEGRGGNIAITAGVFLADPPSQVRASSALGIDGQVDIRAPVAALSGLVAALPQTFASAVTVLRDRCAARLRQGTVSSLVERGRDGMPAMPTGVLPSRLVRETSEAAPAAQTDPASAAPPGIALGELRAEANGQYRISNGPVWALSLRSPLWECTAR